MSTDPMDLLDQYRTSEEDAKKAAEDNLIPTNTYEGQAQSCVVSVVDKVSDLFYGDPMARVTVELYNVEGVTRPFSFNTTPVVKYNGNRMASQSKAALMLAKATGTVGKPFKETLEASKVVRLKYRVRLSPGGTNKNTGQVYEPGNWLDAVRAL